MKVTPTQLDLHHAQPYRLSRWITCVVALATTLGAWCAFSDARALASDQVRGGNETSLNGGLPPEARGLVAGGGGGGELEVGVHADTARNNQTRGPGAHTRPRFHLSNTSQRDGKPFLMKGTPQGGMDTAQLRLY